MPDDLFPEPEPDDWEPQSLEGDDKWGPLDPKQYQSVLIPLDIPPYVPPPDHTAPVVGGGPGTGVGPRDHLSALTLEQRAELLAQNNVFLSKRQVPGKNDDSLGFMHAYVVGKNDLHPVRRYAVRFKKVTLEHARFKRKDNITFSYNQFESDLQKHLISENQFGAGVPELFKANASYGYASASAEHDRTVSVHFAANQWIPKAMVILEPEDITLDPAFVQKVAEICRSSQSTHLRAIALLSVLEEYGQFVPLGILLGGRMSLTEVKTLNDKRTFEGVKHKFGLAAEARFNVRGKTVQGGGGTDDVVWTTTDQQAIAQAKTLKMELVGGDERLASSNPVALDGKWIDSLGSYKEWDVFGFADKSLVSILEFLPTPDLRRDCETALRSYFLEKLVPKESRRAGHTGGKALADKDLKYQSDGKSYDGELKRNARGFSQIVVNAEGNIDGLKLNYHVYTPGLNVSNPTTSISGTFGNIRSGHNWEPIDFKTGEQIAALECWIDEKTDKKKPVLKRLAIRTSARRFPDKDGFYGTNHESTYTYDVIEAPRVRALRAYSGAYIHCLGLTYLDLMDDAESRNFLLAMEPILFPTRDYGHLQK